MHNFSLRFGQYLKYNYWKENSLTEAIAYNLTDFVTPAVTSQLAGCALASMLARWSMHMLVYN